MTDDEAKVLAALRRKGRSTASGLHQECEMRVLDVFRVLEALMAAGVVVDEWDPPQGRVPLRYYRVRDEGQ